jgi:hypothetical protein
MLSFYWALLAAPLASANFRINCKALSHERLDALVSPGKGGQLAKTVESEHARLSRRSRPRILWRQ